MALRFGEEPQTRFTIDSPATEEVINALFGQPEPITPEVQWSAVVAGVDEGHGDLLG
jgi:hypothetical protein